MKIRSSNEEVTIYILFFYVTAEIDGCHVKTVICATSALKFRLWLSVTVRRGTPVAAKCSTLSMIKVNQRSRN